MLLVLFIVGCVAALNGILFTLSISAQTKLSRALYDNFLCELPGYILNQENNKTTCNKDELEKYSYSNLSYVSTIFTFALLPLVILLYMITWQRCMKWMKVLQEIQQKNNFKFVKA